MAPLRYLFALAGAMCLTVANGLSFRNAPGTTDMDTMRTVRKAVEASLVEKRDSTTTMKNYTSFAQTYSYVTLFSDDSNAVSVVCDYCYINGGVTSEFLLQPNTNITAVLLAFEQQYEAQLEAISTAAVKQLLLGLATDLATGKNISNLTPPTLTNVDFHIPVKPISGVQAAVIYESLEIYMKLDTILESGSTYKIRLFENDKMVFTYSNYLDLEVAVVADLLVKSDTAVDIRNGFHLKMDSLQFSWDMFSNNISTVSLSEGTYEFLPVTVTGAGSSFEAVLRLGARAGIVASTPPPTSAAAAAGNVQVAVGLESAVEADIAHWQTNVTAQSDSACPFKVSEAYTVAVGAAVAARVAVGTHTWAAAAATSTPLFYTAVASACATSKASSVHARAVERAAASSTAVTATKCGGADLACPISAQITTTASAAVRDVVGTITSGAAGAAATVTSGVVGFGASASSFVASSGNPTSYVPSATAIVNDANNVWNGSTGGVSNKLIIGLSVGLGGGALLAGIIAACCHLSRRKKYAPLPN